MVYASFQILEQAIEGAGTLDRDAVSAYIDANDFDTIMGEISWDEFNNNSAYWTVGQWQGGVFKGVASTGREGAVPAVLSKAGKSSRTRELVQRSFQRGAALLFRPLSS